MVFVFILLYLLECISTVCLCVWKRVFVNVLVVFSRGGVWTDGDHAGLLLKESSRRWVCSRSVFFNLVSSYQQGCCLLHHVRRPHLGREPSAFKHLLQHNGEGRKMTMTIWRV